MLKAVIGLLSVAASWGLTEPPLYSPPVYPPSTLPGYGHQNAMACQCNSTTRYELDPTPSKVFLFSNAQAMVNFSDALNPRLPGHVTFVCGCKAVPPTDTTHKPRNYIISANQTDPDGMSADECLGSELMEAVCTGLNDLTLFRCETVWRSGVAGTTADNLQRNDALLEAVHRLCAARGGPCASTIVFQDLLDEILPGLA